MHCFGHIREGYGTRLIAWDKVEAIDNGSSDPLESDNTREQTLNPYPEAKECPIRFSKETLMANAAIMTGEYELMHAHWLLDLDLLRA